MGRTGARVARPAGGAGDLGLDRAAAHGHLSPGRVYLRHQADRPVIQMRQARPAGGRRHHEPRGCNRRRSQAAVAEPAPLDYRKPSAPGPRRADQASSKVEANRPAIARGAFAAPVEFSIRWKRSGSGGAFVRRIRWREPNRGNSPKGLGRRRPASGKKRRVRRVPFCGRRPGRG